VARVNAVRQLLSRIFATLACVFQAHVRVSVQREQFLLAVMSVFQPSLFTLDWVNKKEEAALVEELCQLGAKFCVADSDVSKGHIGVIPSSPLGLPRRVRTGDVWISLDYVRSS